MLKLYNTRTRRKEEFTPLDASNVRMYVCGPTVYDYAHIGNARPVIVFDVLFRLLRHLYGEDHVTYVRNITDVDDKINARAAEQYSDMPLNEAIRKVTEETAAQFHRDVKALGCLEPTHEPRATEHIDDMKRMIETLVEKGCAYAAEGHVLFQVAAMEDYGQLSRRSLDEMQAGARVEVAPYKRDPMDFVLWKPSREGEPGWPSPCGIEGLGRPGWHIECSAMADRLLWEEVKEKLTSGGREHPHVFDIHGGGIDLVFPHHENELAQSRCAHDADMMAQIWMHNGFLQVEGNKMSKSLGNFVTIHESLTGWEGYGWPGEVLRLAMLKTHYREPINWTVSRLRESWTELEDWVEAVQHNADQNAYGELTIQSGYSLDPEVQAALLDDLNTPEAVTRIREIFKQARNGNSEKAIGLGNTLAWLGVYRPEMHWAYLRSSHEEADVGPSLLSKYRDAFLNARATVLNEYRWKENNYIERQRSRLEVEEKINLLDARMADDQVRFELDEHCFISLVPTGNGKPGDEVETLIQARIAARKAKDWAEADRIRDELVAMGIVLMDGKDPETGELVTTWEIAR